MPRHTDPKPKPGRERLDRHQTNPFLLLTERAGRAIARAMGTVAEGHIRSATDPNALAGHLYAPTSARQAAVDIGGTLPVVGEAMDVYDIGAGAKKIVEGRPVEGGIQGGLGALGFVLPFVAGRTLRPRPGAPGAPSGARRGSPRGRATGQPVQMDAGAPPAATFRAEHYSRQSGLEELDPAFQFSGQPGAERKVHSAFPEEYVPRSFLYRAGARPEVQFRGLNRYAADLPDAKILRENQLQPFYDRATRAIRAEGRVPVEGLVSARAERLMRDAGFEGYMVGDVVAKFTPTPVRPATGRPPAPRGPRRAVPDPDYDPFADVRDEVYDDSVFDDVPTPRARTPRAKKTTAAPVEPPPARLIDGAPDLGPDLNRRRAEWQDRFRQWTERSDTPAPTGAFGTMRLPSKAEGIDEEFAAEVARAYGRAKSTPDDPATRAAYEQFAKEIDAQYAFVTEELGIKMEPSDADPYRGPSGGPDSKAMAKDLFENRRLKVYTGGSDHPLLTPEQNVRFRFIHDVLGHGLFGNSFAARGEEGAFRAHSETFSEAARAAMATETRGQNSWVNYGPNKHLPANRRPFAEQKVFLLPENLRSGTPAPLSAERRVEIRTREATRNKFARDARIAEIEKNLLPDERVQFERQIDAMADVYSRLPSPRTLASAALEGRAQRGWYESSGRALAEAFGADAPRFAALLAATSPQVPVDRNMKIALETWANWTKAGRPTDPDAVAAMIARGGIPSAVPGAVRALTVADDVLLDPKTLAGGLLEGPKTDPFWANLMGETRRVVLDTHMLKGAGSDVPLTVGKRVPYAAALRNAGEEIGRLTGTTPEPREVQEMVWAYVKSLRDLTRGGGSAVEALPALREPDLLGESALGGAVKSAPSFGTLMGERRFSPLLEAAGARQPTPTAPRGMEIPDPSVIRERDLLDVARRIDLMRLGRPLFTLGALAAGRGVLERDSR